MHSMPENEDQKTLRQRVRAVLGAGLLPLGRLSSVIRRGTGRACLVCDRVIDPTELEYEVQLDDRGARTVFVHEPCYRLWRVETNAIVGPGAQHGNPP
jgi:hypothetical protein